jgi:hypothetical protein
MHARRTIMYAISDTDSQTNPGLGRTLLHVADPIQPAAAETSMQQLTADAEWRTCYAGCRCFDVRYM